MMSFSGKDCSDINLYMLLDYKGVLFRHSHTLFLHILPNLYYSHRRKLHHRLATSQSPGLNVKFVSFFALLASSRKSPETTEILKMAEESSPSEESRRQLVYLR